MELFLMASHFAVCRMNPNEQVVLPPESIFFCVTRTAEELSIVCEEQLAPPGARVEHGWRALKVAGPLDFSLTGVLAGLAGALAAAQVSLFAVSTFDTDYILVRERDLPAALATLRGAGYTVPAFPRA